MIFKFQIDIPFKYYVCLSDSLKNSSYFFTISFLPLFLIGIILSFIIIKSESTNISPLVSYRNILLKIRKYILDNKNKNHQIFGKF